MKARLGIRRNGDHSDPLVLDGDGLKAISVAVDAKPHAFEETPEALTLRDLPASFTLETEVEIDPSANTALMGLYISGGRFCTQCEVESFRRITWFLDRPDVLARYTVRMEADQAFDRLPANGNRVETGGWFSAPDQTFAVPPEAGSAEGLFGVGSGRAIPAAAIRRCSPRTLRIRLGSP